jgi:hypothetical protein
MTSKQYCYVWVSVCLAVVLGVGAGLLRNHGCFLSEQQGKAPALTAEQELWVRKLSGLTNGMLRVDVVRLLGLEDSVAKKSGSRNRTLVRYMMKSCIVELVYDCSRDPAGVLRSAEVKKRL